MDIVSIDVAYHIVKHLDPGSWLALRAACRVWASYFETLCRVERFAAALGRPLGLKLNEIDYRWKETPRNRYFLATVFRAHALDLEKYIYWRFEVEGMAFEDARDRKHALLALDIDKIIDSEIAFGFHVRQNDYHITRLAKDEDIIRGLHRPECFQEAMTRNLEVWESYEKVLSRPEISIEYCCVPRARRPFMRKFVRNINCDYRIYWKDCDVCLRVISKALTRKLLFILKEAYPAKESKLDDAAFVQTACSKIRRKYGYSVIVSMGELAICIAELYIKITKKDELMKLLHVNPTMW